MSLSLYMDVHVPYSITIALRLRGLDVLTAQEDCASEFPDPALLDRASTLGRILFTQDKDFLREGSRRQVAGESFAGIVYAHQAEVTISQCINDLELIAKAYQPEDLASRIEYLPL